MAIYSVKKSPLTILRAEPKARIAWTSSCIFVDMDDSVYSQSQFYAHRKIVRIFLKEMSIKVDSPSE